MKTFSIISFLFFANVCLAQIDTTQTMSEKSYPPAVLMDNAALAKHFQSSERADEIKATTYILYRDKLYPYRKIFELKKAAINKLKIIKNQDSIANLTNKVVKTIIVVK